MGMMLDEELRTFEENKSELLSASEGKFVLIKENCVLGIFETQAEAIGEGYRRLGNVPFLTREIAEREIPEGVTFYEPIGLAPYKGIEAWSGEEEVSSPQRIA